MASVYFDGQQFVYIPMNINRYLRIGCFSIFVLLIAAKTNAQEQDSRGQYPFLLKNGYLGVHAGYIHYPFTNANAEPGYTAATIIRPAPALRIVFGHQFNKYLSAQISYMRPILWVEYRDVNGDKAEHAVFMNVAGLTAKGTLPIHKKLSVYAEGGLSIVTRSGFHVHDTEDAVTSTNYASYQLGGGVQYQLNKRWELGAGFVFAAGKNDVKQPNTTFYSLGLNYHMQPLSAALVAKNNSGGYIFPKNLLQIGFTTNAVGYGTNSWFTKRPIPIFWDGDIDVATGISVQYERNAYHGRRFFSLEWGANLSFLQSKINKEQFFSVSLFPLFRFIPLRTKPLDLYFNYALAGPTFISRKTIDNMKSGEHFTFYDFMGIGAFMGPKRKVNAEVRIAHYSNGNLFYDNPGVTIPLVFNFGYTF